MAAVAFDTNRSLYLSNVYFKGFGAVTASAPSTPAFRLNPATWNQVEELSLGRPIPGTTGKTCPAGINMSIFQNGRKAAQPWLARLPTLCL